VERRAHLVVDGPVPRSGVNLAIFGLQSAVALKTNISDDIKTNGIFQLADNDNDDP
jgi:hypothetical protein